MEFSIPNTSRYKFLSYFMWSMFKLQTILGRVSVSSKRTFDLKKITLKLIFAEKLKWFEKERRGGGGGGESEREREERINE